MTTLLLILVLEQFSTGSSVYAASIQKESVKYGLDPLLVTAVMFKESRFKNYACYKGAHGLMQIQIKPKRCSQYTLALAASKGLYLPTKNIKEGVKLLYQWKRWCKYKRCNYSYLLHYNQGFGKCISGKRYCKTINRVPVLVGKKLNYSLDIMKYYKNLCRIQRKIKNQFLILGV